MLLRSDAWHKYHSAQKRFTKPLIERFFETELPKMFGPGLRSTIADRLLDIFVSNSVDTKSINPGQILWNAVDKNTRADSPQMKLVPVILTIICEEDISNLEKETSITEHKQNVIARITQQAYDQGALLSMRDISLLMNTDRHTVTRLRQNYEKEYNITLPHTGNLQDMGTCITHKYQIIYKSVVEKKDPLIIARETNHTIKAVDRYLKDYNRVKTLYLDNKPPEYIKLTTNMPIFVIKQYINIIEQYVKEPKKN